MSFRAKVLGNLSTKEREQLTFVCAMWYALIQQQINGGQIDQQLLVDVQAILFEIGISQFDAMSLAVGLPEDKLWSQEKAGILARVRIRLGQLDQTKHFQPGLPGASKS